MKAGRGRLWFWGKHEAKKPPVGVSRGVGVGAAGHCKRLYHTRQHRGTGWGNAGALHAPILNGTPFAGDTLVFGQATAAYEVGTNGGEVTSWSVNAADDQRRH